MAVGRLGETWFPPFRPDFLLHWKKLPTPGNTASTVCSVQGTSRMSAAESSTEPTECTKSSRGKNSTNSLEQKIRCLEKQRKELLEVNQQWDQQFRSMKELYERKVTELKTKLDATKRLLSTLEKERPPNQRASDWPSDLLPERQQREEKEKESLHEELHELKKENKLLKESNALVNRKKEHYECEIKRLNKALQDALAIERSSFPEDRLGKSEEERSHEEMRTEMEVLKHQVQIYEEDFKRERSDRERLNQEKEELQRINQTSQSQLNKLKSKIKACQMEKEKLEKQLKQMHFPTCNCSLDFHPRDAGAPTRPGAVQDLRTFPPDRPWCAPEPLPPDARHTAQVSESASLLGAEMRTSGGAVSSPRTPRLCGSPKARDTSAIPGRVCYPDVLKEVTGRQTEGPKVSELVPQ
ncbi:TNFAIP3-interacting protein 3 isoform X2 [Pteropus medius]|uniref:TNFAIP3-interacting protein 3 isoform X2 n=1 Tax=Pteropus vampyrus TaxID=132908 RepID=UPI00196AF30C|nr:TNFAIP3-interacting protein 3 isoform X2 [Pteropus giganteus]